MQAEKASLAAVNSEKISSSAIPNSTSYPLPENSRRNIANTMSTNRASAARVRVTFLDLPREIRQKILYHSLTLELSVTENKP
jgi:hypothetical protein